MAENMFSSKAAILGWLNSVLGLKLERIEDTCNGAVACQLMDCLHPGTVNMKKVDFNVRNDYEFVGNYKELQQAFTKTGIDRAFNVAALSKGKLQDNNEFMQWFKGYWDSVTGGYAIEDYDPVSRRQICKTGDWKKWSAGSVSSCSGAGPRPSSRAPSASGETIAAYRKQSGVSVGSRAGVGASFTKADMKASTIATAQLQEAQAEIAELTDDVNDLRSKLETLENERDFYFDKLRDIEILCQWPEIAKLPITKVIEKILFAADAEEGQQVMEAAASLYNPAALEAGQDQ
ncbi:hypothetical protein QBZ16_001210 [Prototheca wickerhamii]|uniref:Uncharacterized protein n=1 Tax=Prototheca wickerhamii TaxID=3111 RepID=A0AAD9MKF8_PROWI|nr:hypothetical protein QBZ16_001210 [Prototheca wickerhamii]